MFIITQEDSDFPALLAHLSNAKEMARLMKDGKLVIVKASNQFVMLSDIESPSAV